MENLFQDEEKIKLFSNIHNNLHLLPLNANDEQIDELLSKIPQNIFTEKDDLMVVCEMFAIYARILPKSKKNNVFKLFEKILPQIKKYLLNESSFFWKIFGGLNYFKLFMFEEGLISIEQIIQSFKLSHLKYSEINEYFLPEIAEKEPELYEKEIKHLIKEPFSIEKIKEIRGKHLKWLREINDYNSPLYGEIENNKLRLAIKLDDVDQFQRILSKTNLSIDSSIQESCYESFLVINRGISLIEYSIHYNSINIFRFLLMKEAKINLSTVHAAVCSGDYEIFHLIETKIEKVSIQSVWSSIISWNDEFLNYIFDNYDDFTFLEQKDISIEFNETILNLFLMTFNYLNFSFFEQKLLPFIKNNQNFFIENKEKILFVSFQNMSCYFLKEFFKCPLITMNYVDKDSDHSFLIEAITCNNSNAVDFLLKNCKDVDSLCGKSFYPLECAVRTYADIKIVNSLFKDPNIKMDINHRSTNFSPNCFQAAAFDGNYYALKYFIENGNDIQCDFIGVILFECLEKHNFMTLKLFTSYIVDNDKDVSFESLWRLVEEYFEDDEKFKIEYRQELKLIFDEVSQEKKINKDIV